MIVGSSNPIETLMQLAEDFPRHATELARRVEIEGDFQFEMAKVSRMVPKGVSMAWLNGKVIDTPDEFNPFKYVDAFQPVVFVGCSNLPLTAF
jgi:UDP-glucose:glycoprotein glucosyltransferase